MTQQPEPLRLADRLTSPNACPWDNYDAADELRRLHKQYEDCKASLATSTGRIGVLFEQKKQLLAALEEISNAVVYAPEDGFAEVAACVRIARAAIAAAKEQA